MIRVGVWRRISSASSGGTILMALAPRMFCHSRSRASANWSRSSLDKFFSYSQRYAVADGHQEGPIGVAGLLEAVVEALAAGG